MKSFNEALFKNLTENADKNYTDNYDNIRFSVPGKVKFKKSLKNKVKDYIIIKFIRHKLPGSSDIQNIMRADILYHLLEDDGSKELLTSLLSYRLLGHRKVKLPINTPEYHKLREKMISRSDNNQADSIKIKHHPFMLYKHNLSDIGYPIKFYYGKGGGFNTFILKQYEYTKNNGDTIKAAVNDVVIDAGACYGDTPLYFASEVGAKGKVISFEFVPSNLEILNKNLELNPDLSSRVTVIDRPLWDEDNVSFYVKDSGPSSRVSMEKPKSGTSDLTVKSVTIDSIAESLKLKSVDFIKMDIEGAELPALQGAVNVLNKFKPKLAISIYHRKDDFYTIPEFINSLDLGYKFYLKHCTIHNEETVLFAEI